MKYFQLLNEIYKLGKVVDPNENSNNPNRKEAIHELINVQLEIEKNNIFCVDEIRPLTAVREYLMGEMAWYFSGDRTTSYIAKYSKFWNKISNEDGTSNSNYGNLIFYKKSSHPLHSTPFEWAREALENDKHSRQGLVLYNSRDFNYRGNKDYICSQYQHFLIRGNKLICIIGLRSSDAIYGLTYNIPWWSIVHQTMLLSLREHYPELEEGKIYVNISSAHIYESKIGLVGDMLNHPKKEYRLELNKIIPLGKGFNWYEEQIKNYIDIN